jgi:hypothetical protein
LKKKRLRPLKRIKNSHLKRSLKSPKKKKRRSNQLSLNQPKRPLRSNLLHSLLRRAHRPRSSNLLLLLTRRVLRRDNKYKKKMTKKMRSKMKTTIWRMKTKRIAALLRREVESPRNPHLSSRMTSWLSYLTLKSFLALSLSSVS